MAHDISGNELQVNNIIWFPQSSAAMGVGKITEIIDTSNSNIPVDAYYPGTWLRIVTPSFIRRWPRRRLPGWPRGEVKIHGTLAKVGVKDISCLRVFNFDTLQNIRISKPYWTQQRDMQLIVRQMTGPLIVRLLEGAV